MRHQQRLRKKQRKNRHPAAARLRSSHTQRRRMRKFPQRSDVWKSAARVQFFVQRLQALTIDMRVNLRGRDVTVT